MSSIAHPEQIAGYCTFSLRSLYKTKIFVGIPLNSITTFVAHPVVLVILHICLRAMSDGNITGTTYTRYTQTQASEGVIPQVED